ncbi:zinc ribbon domain-containing protein [Desulfallas sp. Bu1-1]|jgi:serine phosphatase RsbU (regulator of sigma subunit)|uniref:zinc ribbon domain-containing protein n=1 Tax=Desulfallas sp. Bu1-1 TaxID=2787620 RepID=UPI00189C60E8|nr:zinc ribbon domain-containing protein [Desulfallas sp. Bu1-1]MBF7083140.1 zinc ribbon domain-containing protein [Desulfallas sp. Bu1-1]
MSFIQKIADGAKHLGSRARDLGGIAGGKARDITKKSSELLEYTRLRHELRKMEREMENNLAGIGALYYQQQSGQDGVDEELKRLIESTRELELEMKELEEQIASLQPAPPSCSDCGKDLPDGGKYCSYCGKKIVE